MRYDYFQEERSNYENIEIPDELLFLVRETVAADRKKKAAARRNRILKTVGSAAAVLFLSLTIGVNSSYAFAEAAVKIPVVKDVAQAVVVRSYRPEIMAVYAEHKVSNRAEKMTEEISEKQPEEPMPAESGNDVLPVQEETLEQQPAQETVAEALTGFEAWKAEMTPEKYREITELYTPEMEEKYADTPEQLRTILLAELPEKEVSLYGYHEDGRISGIALLVKDICQYFDWNYMNDSKKLPDISCVDMDGDEVEEIVVFLYNKKLEMTELSREETEAFETIDEKDTSMPKEMTANEKNMSNFQESVSETAQAGGGKETAAESNTGSGAENKNPSVSGNDIIEPVKEGTLGQQPGEIWAVSIIEEIWTASVLSVEDYESWILRRLTAADNDMAAQ